MSRIILSVVIYFSLVLPVAAQYDCQIKWHVHEGAGSKAFSYTGKGAITILDHVRIQIEGDKAKSSFLLFPSFNEKQKDNISYSLSCSSAFECSGSRKEPGVAGKSPVEKKFQFDGHRGVASLLQREIMRFYTTKTGFRYSFFRKEVSAVQYQWHLDLFCNEKSAQ